MQDDFERPHPLAWPITLTGLFSICAAVCFGAVAASIVTGITHKGCPCHRSSNPSETGHRKECCFQSEGDGICSTDQCVCIMMNTDAYSRFSDGLPQLTMDSIRCKDKHRTLTDAAVFAVCFFGVLGFGFVLATTCAIMSCCYIRVAIAAASSTGDDSDETSVTIHPTDIEQADVARHK